MIPRSVIEEVIARADIVEVVSRYIPLKRRGQSHVGLCPFHSEKTPSFTVSEEKGLFYCFGCHAGGNAVTFLMQHNGLSFAEALKTLAHRYGVKIEEEKRAGEFEEIFRLNAAACEFFVKELKRNAVAQNYLKARGFEGETPDSFRVGYAPCGGAALAEHLKRGSFDLALAEKTGLLGRKDGRYYDRFRGRIIFPITDSSGRIIAFGARSIDGSEPKYLNSPESPIFKKSSTLYGLYRARPFIEKAGSAIIVEGYFDLMALYRDGFKNSVATMGTALTEEHVRRLGHSRALYALFDSDAAGIKAAVRSVDKFIAEEGLEARAVILRGAKDPDEFLKSHGPQALRKAIEGAPLIMDFFLKELKENADLTAPSGKAYYLNSALPYLRKIKNIAVRGHYAAMVAGAIGLDVRAVYRAMEERTSISFEGLVKTTPHAESMLLKVLFKHPEFYDERVEEAFRKFKDPLLREVASFFSAGHKEARWDIGGLENPETREFAAKALFAEENWNSPEKVFEDCLVKLLSAGKVRDATEKLLRGLEEAGRKELAEKILERLGKKRR